MLSIKVFSFVLNISLFLGLFPAISQKKSFSWRDEKRAYADSLLEVSAQTKDSLNMAEAYYLLGKISLSDGDYLASQTYFMLSLRLLEKFGDSYELGRLYIRLRDKEERQQHFGEAMRYLQAALGVFRRIDSKIGLMRVYAGIGDSYANLKLKSASQQPHNIRFNTDSAFFYFRKAEALSVVLKDTVALANIWISLGKLLMDKKDPEAINYFQKALNEFSRLKKENERVSALLFLASAYLTFNQTQKVLAMLTEVKRFYEKEHLDRHPSLPMLETAYVNYYKATAHWKEAFRHLEVLKELERKELVEDQQGAISRLEIEYKTQKNEALLQKRSKELEFTNANVLMHQRLLAVFAILLLLMAGFAFFYFRLSSKNRQISHRNAVLVREQNHRVKNNLQLISSLLSLQANQFSDTNSKKATENNLLRIESMAILHRKLYDNEELAVINLADFIREIVEMVLNTFACTHIEPKYAISSIKLNPDQALPIGLIITELVTNACKYAFPDNSDPILTISCYKEKDELILSIADNGSGLKNNSIDMGVKTSFGIRLIQMQVAQLRGSYIFEELEGTRFTMKFKPD